MQNESLVLPLLLKDHAQGYILEQACDTSSPTKLIGWGLDGEQREEACGAGVAMGCEDGSVYLFSVDSSTYRADSVANPVDLTSGKHPGSAVHVSLASQIPQPPSPSPPSTPSLKSHPRSRTTSQSIHAVPHPLSHPTRSRVTSSVSKASAEAPKNYVDYEDEKEKLQGMLKGGPSVKEKSITDGLRASYGVAGLGLSSGRDGSKPNGGSKRKSLRLSFPGNISSVSGTPRDSLSSPPSSTSLSSLPSPAQPTSTTEIGRLQHVGPAPSLTLKFHVFPPRFGLGHDVIALHRLSSGTLLSLQKSGTVSVISIQSGYCLASVHLESTPYLHPPPQPSPSAFLSTSADNAIWAWKALHVVEGPESTILLATASDQASATNDGDPETRTRVAVLQLQKISPLSVSLDSSSTTRHSVLQKAGEWIIEGAFEIVGLLEGETSSPKLYYVTPGPSSKLVAHSLQVVPSAFAVAAPDSLQPSLDALSSSSSAPIATTASLPNLSLSIPNPFKPKNLGQPSGAAPDKAAAVAAIPGRVVLGPDEPLGQLPTPEGDKCVKGMHIWNMGVETVRGVLWGSTEFLVFETQSAKEDFQILARSSHHGLASVDRIGTDIIVLLAKRRMDTYRLFVTGESLGPSKLPCKVEHISWTGFPKQCHGTITVSPSLILCSRTKTDSAGSKHLKLTYTSITPLPVKSAQDRRSRDDKYKARTAWSASTAKRPVGRNTHRVTSLLPLELDLIILGYNNGSVEKSSLADLLTVGWPTPRESVPHLNGMITSLHYVKNERTGQKLVIGGVDDGGIAVWDLSTLQLRARWTIFTAPLLTVIHLEEESVGHLRGCILCASDDGTLAVIAVDGLELLYLIPGSAARLTRICLGEDNLLLMYADRKARLWDVKTQVFWRSISSKTADELREQGGWFEAEIDYTIPQCRGTSLALLQKCFSSYDAASTLLLNIRALSDLIHPLSASYLFRHPRQPEDTSIRTKEQASTEVVTPAKRIPRRLKFLQALLGSLLSFGLDDNIDQICRDKLAIVPSLAAVGLSSANSAVSLLTSTGPRDAWQVSPEHTASRLLALITILRGLLTFDEECEQHANQVITFYIASLRDAVGPSWQAPSLSFLAHYWFHPSSELRLAARALFGATADRLSDNDTICLVEHWQHELPCLQPDAEKQSAYSALALLIAGNVAAERYTVLSASTLTDIAKSITLYLHDEGCPHRALAIDLCSRGFQIWQHYVDAMEVLRALFSLATSAEKERNAGPQARLAVLQIASSNTPLFMTTLSLDILHPRSVQQRKSIMQLVAFLIRKKPLVLYPNLPRLVEAVVKSLDPGSSGDRETVFDAATEILGQVVKTFPSVDFHMPTQRLGVGTSEGAVIVYDLKTATRLYVLEGHKRRLTACSFSPDGRRLVTVSLEESLVRVWKVGSSIVSIFMPGAPPRQGHSGSEPFKTLNFNVGDEAHMTVASTLEWVQFEWPTDRTARLKIRDSAFTFNT